jgi:hypothetical protein
VKKHVSVFLNCSPEGWPSLKELFQAIGRYDLVRAGNAEFGWELEFTLPSPEYDLLQTEARNRGIGWHETRTLKATDRELASAPFLRIRLGSEPVPYRTRVEDSFDFTSGCPACGTGAIARESIVVQGDSGSRIDFDKAFIGLTSEGTLTVVSEPVWVAFQNAKITGFRLSPLVEADSGRQIPLRAIIPSESMPFKMDPKTEGLVRSDSPSEGGCQVCHRDGYFETPEVPLQIFYSSGSNLGSLPNISETWERFGVSGRPSLRAKMEGLEARVAPSLLLVRPKVLDILRDLRCSGVVATPVQS